MRLYIMRHAPAVRHGAPGYGQDAARPLTDEGFEVSRLAGNALSKLGVEPEIIITSPYTRAAQTAREAARFLPKKIPIRQLAELKPEVSPEQTSAALEAVYGSNERILVVGHEPHLSRWISELLTGTDKLECVMKKGSIACIEIGALSSRAGGRLRWLLTPKQLSLIGRLKAAGSE